MLIEGVECIKLKDAAASSGYAEEHLRHMARKGQAKAHKVGRDWWYEVGALDEYRAQSPWRGPKKADK